MATIAEQLTSLANTKTAIKQAIINKGVSVADTDPFSAYPAKIGEIQAGGGTATKFGASVDTFLGDVVNGVLQAPTEPTALNFTGVTNIRSSAMEYAFYKLTNITSVDLSSLQTVSLRGLYYAFSGCTGITGTLDLSSLQSVDVNGLYYAFAGCTGITSVDLSSLQSVDSYGLQAVFSNCSNITSVDLSSLQSVRSSGLSSAFSNCSNIISVDLSSLQSVPGNSGMYYAFNNCRSLTTISFPSLTSAHITGLNYAFQNCTALTEIHFRADAQATIEALNGYSSKFGATNATIIFDL